MAKVTKSGARSVSNVLDRVATLFQQDWKALGVPEKIAADFAYRCDLLSDRVERTAGIDRKALNELDVMKEPGFNPEDIGMEQTGPIETVDTDESFMKGEFTQQENRELRERVQDGDLGMTPVDAPQNPQAGKQAFDAMGRQQMDARLASSASQVRLSMMRAAKHASIRAGLSRLAHAIMDVQMGVLAGTVSAEHALKTVQAVDHILPHLKTLQNTTAAKVAKMVSLANRIAAKKSEDEEEPEAEEPEAEEPEAEEPEKKEASRRRAGEKGKIPPQFLENVKKKQDEAEDKKDDDEKKGAKKAAHGFDLFS